MAENLYEYFHAVFTREDITSQPASEVKFDGRESDYL